MRSMALTASLLVAWLAVPKLLSIEPYVFPDLWLVLSEFSFEPRTIWVNLFYTAAAAILGLAIAVGVGSLMAIGLSFSRPLQKQALPILVASNAIPVVALAPLLALWLGHGIASKVAIAAFLCFFPFTLAFLDGLSRTRTTLSELFTTLGASRLERFRHLTLPNAVAHMVTGLKVTASIAVIGAVVGEFVGSDRGLGFGILQASYSLNTPRLFAYILVACVLSLLFYALPRAFESMLQRRGYYGDI